MLQEEIGRSISLGVRGFPALILVNGNAGIHLQHDYNDAELTVKRIIEGIDTLERRVAQE